MERVTRRALLVSGVLSGAALLTETALMPAEAATGSISLNIVNAGFIFGVVAGGSCMLRFGATDYPLSVGGISSRSSETERRRARINSAELGTLLGFADSASPSEHRPISTLVPDTQTKHLEARRRTLNSTP
jgi:hypothetical protein